MQGDQDRGGQCNPKLGGGRAAGGEIGGKCISGYRQYAIRSILGKARLDRAYPRYKVSSSLVAGSRGLRRGVKRQNPRSTSCCLSIRDDKKIHICAGISITATVDLRRL